MATSVETNQPLAANPDLGSDSGNGVDPFSISGAPNHHRFSHFDNQLFALGPAASPEQAKRALEAHLAETERRIQDASKLGTTLVQQRKELSDRLKEVEKQQNDGDITPELRQKLVEIEKEYNEVGRESARAFLPKTRLSSSEMAGSPFIGDGKRSISPSKFESQATNSPSKISVPNRKQRNQPSNRVHDIEFATEISTSLLSQVRHLQTLLAEKEESLRALALDKSKLETEAEGFHQRLRSLDESEHRYKDENWNLETQIHEHIAGAKEAADKEKKLTQNLNILQSEKAAAQKELDEIKLSHATLVEDHAAIIKHHDAEIGSMKRNMVAVDNERSVLQRKIDELTGQNQQLAMALSQQRGRSDEQERSRGLSDEEFETANDNITPEHSPPPSPVKGTPRHSMLESETLKSSLNHAHRMIQNLKGNIHREKTEKLELKRMLQDARDELESRRGDSGITSGTSKRTRKVESREFKKPLKPGQLGGLRSSHNEISVDEANWEDHNDQDYPETSAAARVGAGFAAGIVASRAIHESGNRFDKSNETSDAFETANEKGTETEDFHTGLEDLSGSDELTETEAGSEARGKRPSPLPLMQPGNRQSFQSTASLSGDDLGFDDIKTPTQTQPQRMRLKMNRGGYRRTRLGSEEPQFAASPSSFATSSNNGTPQGPAQTLFAELGDLNGSDEEESVDGTPSRRNLASPAGSSASRPATAKSVAESSGAPDFRPIMSKSINDSPSPAQVTRPVMTDSGMMTDDWLPSPTTPLTAIPLVAGAGLAGAGLAEGFHLLHQNRASTTSQPSMPDTASQWHDDQLNHLHVLAPGVRDSRPISTSTYSDMSSQAGADIEEKLASFPSPPSSPSRTIVNGMSGPGTKLAPLTMSSIVAEEVEPTTPKTPTAPTPLAFSSIHAVATEPVEPATPVRSIRRDGVMIPRGDLSNELEAKSPEIRTEEPETPKPGLQSSVFSRSKNKTPVTPIIAEDETRGSPSDSPSVETPESQRPFKELSTNTSERTSKKVKTEMKDEGSQTAMTADQIDSVLSSRSATVSPALKVRRSTESFGSVSRARALMADPDFEHDTVAIRRPGSSSSNHGGSISSGHPPLPSNHQQTIAAVVHRTPSNAGQGTMGPPLVPASAYRSNPSFRPRTPSQTAASPTRGGTTPRAVQAGAETEAHSPIGNNKSRHSSVTSFASEVDNRFNIGRNGMVQQGVDSGADPRMIQAITQTMIGEFLWKYTRKAGRGEMSENRHRRYFWVHPYTRTLYWSDRDPSTAGRTELRAKSVAIEAVRVVTDDNPMPPGLHRKSLVVLTPGRAVKFTASTGQRHETWFNALSYLLLRTDGTVNDTEEVTTGALTREDVDEFNPGHSNRAVRGRGPPSLSTYNSRTTRNESPNAQSVRASMNEPTLMHSTSTSSRPTAGTLSRLSSYWKPGTAFSSRRSRYGDNANIYEASEVHDSAEDLREIYEKQDRESDRLENVRACCDGKHDVGSLSHSSKKGRNTQNHTHGPARGPSTSQRPGPVTRPSLHKATTS